MIWLSIVLFVLAIAFAIMRNRSHPNGDFSVFTTFVVPIATTLSALFFILSVFTIVRAGNVGVAVVFEDVNPSPLDNGIQLKNPFASIKQMSIRADTYTMSSVAKEGNIEGDDAIYALSSEGLQMPLEVTFAFQLIGSDAPAVFEFIGKDYVEKILRPAARSAVRGAVSHFTSQEAYSTKREELQQKMQERMDEEIARLLANVAGFRGKGFTIASVMLRNVELPDKVKKAIEDKQEADQNAQAMVYVLLKEGQEAERKRIEAQGIADFQRIVTQGISEPLLRWKGIEATEKLAASTNAKVVVIGAGESGLPLILGQ